MFTGYIWHLSRRFCYTATDYATHLLQTRSLCCDNSLSSRNIIRANLQETENCGKFYELFFFFKRMFNIKQIKFATCTYIRRSGNRYKFSANKKKCIFPSPFRLLLPFSVLRLSVFLSRSSENRNARRFCGVNFCPWRRLGQQLCVSRMNRTPLFSSDTVNFISLTALCRSCISPVCSRIFLFLVSPCRQYTFLSLRFSFPICHLARLLESFVTTRYTKTDQLSSFFAVDISPGNRIPPTHVYLCIIMCISKPSRKNGEYLESK